MEYLAQHPEAMEELFPVEEWNEQINVPLLGADDIAALKQNIRDEVFPIATETHRQRVFTLKTWGKVAAAIVLFAVGTWWLRYELSHHQHENKVIAAVEVSTGATSKDSLTWTIQTNHTNKSVSYKLSDGSTIRLEPHASFRYRSDYGQQHRDIYAEGVAFFEVAKDHHHPFTVYAGSLQTTALGTSFRVAATSRKVEVKLITGKVVVKSTGDIRGWKKDVFLSPGDIVSYDSYLAVASVNRVKPATDKPTEVIANANMDASEVVFTNTPIHEVIEKLSAIHHHKVIYDASDIAGKNFTGTISNSDSLIVVLRVICTMNKLEVKEEGDNYTVSKAIP
ncbi:FecR family protein [Chitinophaga sp.]|uniref:FecR family protein n=1 Tax=Chitinophaga sp. TaxID=1869181 RepID=UPI0025B989E5|nr:FecR family protein [Chitinophaga sp.]